MTMFYWIKERENPQTGTYFVAMGQMETEAALDHEKTIYGKNTMHRFLTEAEYEGRLKQLEKQNERVY